MTGFALNQLSRVGALLLAGCASMAADFISKKVSKQEARETLLDVIDKITKVIKSILDSLINKNEEAEGSEGPADSTSSGKASNVEPSSSPDERSEMIQELSIIKKAIKDGSKAIELSDIEPINRVRLQRTLSSLSYITSKLERTCKLDNPKKAKNRGGTLRPETDNFCSGNLAYEQPSMVGTQIQLMSLALALLRITSSSDLNEIYVEGFKKGRSSARTLSQKRGEIFFDLLRDSGFLQHDAKDNANQRARVAIHKVSKVIKKTTKC